MEAMTKHAKLGASGAYRWIACPGSVREIDRLPAHAKEGRSVYAAEGTAAHTLAAQILRCDDSDNWTTDPYVGHWVNAETEEILPRHPNPDDICPDWFEVTREMAEAVQVYLDEVLYHLGRLDNPLLRIEQKFNLDWLRPDMWGTADVVISEEVGELVVADYKHGSGVPVEVEYNEQAMYYALGALGALGADFVSRVTIVVVQPRCPHVDGPVRRWETTPEELMAWSQTLAAAADATREPDAHLAAGTHCRFCPAKPACPALRGLIATECQFPDDLEDSRPLLPDPTDPAQVARALAVVPLLDEWCKSVEGLALRTLEAGHQVPGYKLVRRRANRKWTDEEEVKRKLRAKKGVHADDFLAPRKLLSPAALEKVKAIGKKWVARHDVKPEGGLTVAPDSDPRPAQLAASTEFPDDLPALPAGKEFEATVRETVEDSKKVLAAGPAGPDGTTNDDSTESGGQNPLNLDDSWLGI